jgi:hypothetical protein
VANKQSDWLACWFVCEVVIYVILLDVGVFKWIYLIFFDPNPDPKGLRVAEDYLKG